MPQTPVPPSPSQPPPGRRLEISLTQVAAGALAAACGAWLSSRLGVAGTVIGAALVSALVTLLSAVYAHGARQAQARLRDRVAGRPLGETGAVDDGGWGADPGSTLLLPAVDLDDERGFRWSRIVAGAAIVFLVAMVAVTGWEKATGHPLSCSRCTGTTLDPGRQAATPLHQSGTSSTTAPRSTSPTPSPSSSGAASPSSSPTPSPSSSGTTGPSPTPTPSTSTSGSPSPSSSSSPATSVPSTSPAAVAGAA